MINIKTKCQDCRHDEVCKYKDDWTKQANEWSIAKNKETLVSENIMIATLECRIYSPITYSLNPKAKVKESECCNTYDGWGL